MNAHRRGVRDNLYLASAVLAKPGKMRKFTGPKEMVKRMHGVL